MSTAAPQTYYRVAAKGSRIVAVEVIAAKPVWLTIRDEQGRESEVLRESPAEIYYRTREQAAAIVYERLRQEVLRAHEAVEAFEVREAELKRTAVKPANG